MLTFGNPIVHVDEQFYFVTAYGWLHGALPYVDIWDRKPVGLFLLYLPAAALGVSRGIWAYQAMALACVVATAWLIANLADRAGWNRGALTAALAYVLWLDLVEGQGGQAPVFYNLLMLAAATLIAPREDGTRPGLGRGLATMALVGLSLQIKYTAVFEGLFFGLWLMWCDWRRGYRLAIAPRAAALAVAAALPTLAAWLAFRAAGAGDAWVFSNVTSILQRKPDPMFEQLGNLVKLLVLISPLLAAAIISWHHRRAGPPDSLPTRVWLFAWAGSALLGLLVFGSWFDHYALPVLVPLAVLSSGFFGDHDHGRRIAPWLLAVIFVGGQATVLIKRETRGTPAQFAALVDAVGHGPGCLYVYSGESMLYPASGRCALTRYVFPSHLGRAREQGAIGVNEPAEIARILALRPQIVVLRPPYFGEMAARRAQVMAAMRQSYRLRALKPLGNQQVAVYEHR